MNIGSLPGRHGRFRAQHPAFIKRILSAPYWSDRADQI